MEYTISGANILVLAVFVWFLGSYINRKIAFLERYSIPVAVTGGLVCSAVITLVYYAFDVTVNFDTRLRDLLLLTFFSTIGLSAAAASGRTSGRRSGPGPSSSKPICENEAGASVPVPSFRRIRSAG